MTARSIRRAQERRARKLERKAALQQPSELTDAQRAANRANAQLSTGPKTPEGKAKSSLNAVKSALTGHTVLLPTDDAEEYECHLLDFQNELRPVGPQELAIVQSLADIAWRLRRIPALESAIYAKGRLDFANKFDDQEASLRPGLIDLHTYLTYERQLHNLHLQEARLSRRREKETAELRDLQTRRSQKERHQLDVASKLYLTAQHDGKPFDPADHGFEFPIEDVQAYLEGQRAATIAYASLRNERLRAGMAA
ncbi:MAG TPA: hypothetical protein VGL97_22050 [Bryobacteraceae bacterium]|jgi:hypothetical protein